MAHARPSRLPTPEPVEEYLDLTRMIARRARILTGITTLRVLVVEEAWGAPARYVPATNEVHIHRSVLDGIDPRTIRSVAELNARHPEVMGAILHELMHAMHSMSAAQMESFQRSHGSALYQIVLLLDEGRIEARGFPSLTGIEQEALQAMVPEFVLRDLDTEEQQDAAVKSIKQGIALVGLLTARAESGVLDMDNEKCAAIWGVTVQAMGEWFAPFSDVASAFAKVDLDEHLGTERMLSYAKEWQELERLLIEKHEESKPKPKPEEKPETDQEEEPGESEGGSGESGEGEEEGGEPQQAEGEGEPAEGQDGESGPGEEAEGEQMVPTLGEYAGSSSEVDVDAIRDVIKKLPEVAQEQRAASGTRLQNAIWEIDRATVADHIIRREKNEEAMSRWQ